MNNLFIHHVFFWLNDPQSTQAIEKLRAGLQNLSKVKTIRQYHIGKPADTKRSVIENSYSLSWLVIFDNDADQANYQVDPIHLQFIAECAELWNKVLVYDSTDLI